MDEAGNTDTEGVGALANAIPTMGALTSLNISSNKLTRGAVIPGKEGWSDYVDERYSTDMSGSCDVKLRSPTHNCCCRC